MGGDEDGRFQKSNTYVYICRIHGGCNYDYTDCNYDCNYDNYDNYGLLNVQSLLPKVVSLQHDELRRYNHDLYVLTETWLRPTTPTRLVTFPGYTLHRADRPDGSGFGGVAILCGGGYSGSVIPQPESECATCQLESLWLRVRPATGAPFTLAAVYRPPRRTAAALQADFTELETQ